MSWTSHTDDFAEFSSPVLRGAMPIDPSPERLPWQLATVVILTLSLLLWYAVIAGVSRLLG
jgi:hypothetical protein